MANAAASAAPAPAPDTITEAVARYERHGFVAPFRVGSAGKTHCLSCQAVHGPGTVRMLAMHRLEGASDPADQVAVVAIECPACKKRGTLALGYGPAASVEDKLALAGFNDRRGRDRDLPPGL